MLAEIKNRDHPYTVSPDSVVKQSTIGFGSRIDKDCVVLNAEIGNHVEIEKRNLIRRVVIGDMSYTGADTSIMWAEIGKWCNISRMVDIGGNEHNYHAAAMMQSYRIKNELGGAIAKHPEETMIRVGNDVWIGQGVSILRKEGLVIGDGAVIGSGTVVTKSVPPYAIVVGVPGKVIKYRFSEDMIKRLLQLSWWDWPEEVLLAQKDLLTADLDEDILTKLEYIGKEQAGGEKNGRTVKDHE